MQAPTSIGEVFNYTIKAYDIDAHKRATPLALIRAMHEAAMQNVIRLGISVWDLEPQNLAWVLMSKYVQFERLPILGEKIQILTQPSGFEKVFTYRDYKVLDEAGNTLLYSASTWLLMNTQSRRMTRIPENIRSFEKDIPDAEDCLPRCDVKFNKLEQIHTQEDIKVGWHDLDFNGHANNVQYIRWMLEPLGVVLKEKQLQRLEIQFRAECRWQEVLKSTIQKQEDHSYLHQLSRNEKVLALARTIWR
ncbi:MAG: acyl-ACP thioesterase domain-containing protein [Bacteroidota bacterium]